ncbi:Transmembrane Protease Serine 4 [Manis pentadactyla]|nr:Transmembrane Protease Serine 4 [Manis pentadactyla]
MPGRLLQGLWPRWRRYKYRFVPWIALNLSHNPREDLALGGRPQLQTAEELGRSQSQHGVGLPSKPSAPLGTFRKVGLPIIAALLSLAILVIMAVLVKGLLDKHYFFCGEPLHFIPREQLCDGRKDCASGEDELPCVKSFPDGPPVAEAKC